MEVEMKILSVKGKLFNLGLLKIPISTKNFRIIVLNASGITK
jgi:hypothetical protein